jgi:hypothetical protein
VQVVGGVRRRPSAVAASTSNYVVPLDAAPSGITRPLVEILRDLNKRVPDTIVLPASRRASASDPVVPWYPPSLFLRAPIAVLCLVEIQLINGVMKHRGDLGITTKFRPALSKIQTDLPTMAPGSSYSSETVLTHTVFIR